MEGIKYGSVYLFIRVGRFGGLRYFLVRNFLGLGMFQDVCGAYGGTMFVVVVGSYLCVIRRARLVRRASVLRYSNSSHLISVGNALSNSVLSIRVSSSLIQLVRAYGGIGSYDLANAVQASRAVGLSFLSKSVRVVRYVGATR